MRWIEYGRQGWVRVNGVDGAEVLAKTVEAQGRRVVVDLVLMTDPWPPGVDSSIMRSVPVGWIETMVNSPDGRAALERLDKGTDATAKAIQARADESFERDFAHATERAVPLGRPDGTDPEAFYRRVSEAYTATLATTSKVAPALAAEAGVPVPTVHRWVAEARRRGFLAPAKRGKAG